MKIAAGVTMSSPVLSALRHKFPPEKQESLLKLVILSCSAVLAFSIRLFSVLRYESMIHEFDPYFNYRTTRDAVERCREVAFAVLRAANVW